MFYGTVVTFFIQIFHTILKDPPAHENSLSCYGLEIVIISLSLSPKAASSVMYIFVYMLL